jgi:phosphoglycerate kinase
MRFVGKEPPLLFKNKTTFVRVDFDVSFNKDGTIADDYRIKRCLPTIDYLISKGAKVVLGTKIGDPEKDGGISCERILPYLSNLSHLRFVRDYSGKAVRDAIANLQAEDISLLENLRFFSEEKGDENFAKDFANNFDFYINEAFAMCHRSDTSVAIFPKFLRSYAGFNLAKEVEVLSMVLENPQKPLIFIVGGAKIESKLPTIENFLKIADKIIVGGKLPLDPKAQELAKNPKVLLANLDSSGFDVFADSVSKIVSYLSNLGQSVKKGTIVWSGPMGQFENPDHREGTVAVAKAIAESPHFKIAGGGDTVTAIDSLGLIEKFDFVSTGGGAMLAFLAGEELPGITALNLSL